MYKNMLKKSEEKCITGSVCVNVEKADSESNHKGLWGRYRWDGCLLWPKGNTMMLLPGKGEVKCLRNGQVSRHYDVLPLMTHA